MQLYQQNFPTTIVTYLGFKHCEFISQIPNSIMDLSFFPEQIWWGISIVRLSIAGVLIVLGVLARSIVRRSLSRLLGRLGRSRDIDVVDDVERLLIKPFSLLVNILLWNVVIGILNLPQQPFNIHLWVSTAGIIALMLALAYCALHVVDVFAGIAGRAAAKTETRLDDQLVSPITKTVKIMLVLVLIASIMGQLGYSATGLIAGLSIGGLALAFAAKDTLANVFGSILIFSERPFQIGDVVSINGVEGTVEEVGIRSTKIRQFDQTLSIFPNQTFTTTEIRNLSKRGARRIRFEVTVTQEATVSQLEEYVSSIQHLLEQRTDIHSDQILVRITKFDTTGLVVLVQTFTTVDFVEFMRIREEIMLSVRKLAEEQGLPLMPAQGIQLSGQVTTTASQ